MPSNPAALIRAAPFVGYSSISHCGPQRPPPARLAVRRRSRTARSRRRSPTPKSRFRSRAARPTPGPGRDPPPAHRPARRRRPHRSRPSMATLANPGSALRSRFLFPASLQRVGMGKGTSRREPVFPSSPKEAEDGLRIGLCWAEPGVRIGLFPCSARRPFSSSRPAQRSVPQDGPEQARLRDGRWPEPEERRRTLDERAA